nr:ABC transporter ATP-binding protein [Clostridium puniceum]
MNAFKHKHYFEQLSHGERHLITLFSLLNYIGEKKSLILIDEPCIALDTRWQQNLLSTFNKLCNKPMLIATQSPYMSIDFMNDQVEIDGGLKHV